MNTRQLTPDDIDLMRALLQTFGVAFNDKNTYCGKPPSDLYLRRVLSDSSFIVVVALEDEMIIGGLAAYELKKFEQERSEVYIYDLAVAEPNRRKGVATALINTLKKIAAVRSAYVIFVQADIGDEPAITLYTKLGMREDVLHFDIAVGKADDAG
jgi:aminoglycoside 3-N-acetyltransferase I